MTEPDPAYTASIPGAVLTSPNGSLENIERKLIDALKMIWRLQGKKRKIIRLD